VTPKFAFCSIDFAALEAVTFAQCELWSTGKSKLAQAINKGDDAHSHFTAAWLKCSYEEAYAKRKDKSSPHGKIRNGIAKEALYGFLGGMGAKRFMQAVNKKVKKREDRIDLATAQKARDTHFTAWECQDYFDWCDTFLESDMATVKQFGTGRVRGAVGYTEIRNGWFSSLANDAATAGILPVIEEMLRADKRSPLYGSVPQLFLHDEQLNALRLDRAHDAAFRMRDIMVERAQEFTPDVKMSAMPALSTIWTKAMDTSFDASGKLTCWDLVVCEKCGLTRGEHKEDAEGRLFTTCANGAYGAFNDHPEFLKECGG
jgi:hypothetical protein